MIIDEQPTEGTNQYFSRHLGKQSMEGCENTGSFNVNNYKPIVWRKQSVSNEKKRPVHNRYKSQISGVSELSAVAKP